MAQRFSKQVLIAHLQIMYSQIYTANKFTAKAGTFQLYPPRCSAETKHAIDRAVEYGRMEAMAQVKATVENGSFLTLDK